MLIYVCIITNDNNADRLPVMHDTFLIYVYLMTWAKGVPVSRRHLHYFFIIFYCRLRFEITCTWRWIYSVTLVYWNYVYLIVNILCHLSSRDHQLLSFINKVPLFHSDHSKDLHTVERNMIWLWHMCHFENMNKSETDKTWKNNYANLTILITKVIE